MFWAAALAALLDDHYPRAAGFLAGAALCALLGVIHSPLDPAIIDLPWNVLERMATDPAIRCQSPYHWTAAYGLTALMILGWHFWGMRKNPNPN